jgi:hypothetical protein
MAQTIKTSTVAAVVILAFHKDAFAIARTGHNAGETMAKKMSALLISRYGETCPTYEEYRLDLKALAQLAEERKLASDQWVRKPFCAAIKALWKELPVSMDAAAVLKRAERAAKEEKVAAALKLAEQVAQQTPVGAPKGETQERVPSEAEKLESVVTRLGLYETLYACLRILEADEATKAQVVHMRKMVDKAHTVQQLAEKAKREAAITVQAPATTIVAA